MIVGNSDSRQQIAGT